jgi:hypothetical protein
MAILDKAAILEAQDIVTEEIEVPEWGGSVLVKSLTGAERDSFEQSILIKRGDSYDANMSMVRAKLAAVSIVDEEGQRLFGDGDIKALAAKNAAALDRVFTAASRLSGISADDADELAKNSPAAQNGGSGSG